MQIIQAQVSHNTPHISQFVQAPCTASTKTDQSAAQGDQVPLSTKGAGPTVATGRNGRSRWGKQSPATACRICRGAHVGRQHIAEYVELFHVPKAVGFAVAGANGYKLTYRRSTGPAVARNERTGRA